MRATLTHVVRVRPVRTQWRRTSATRACAQLATSVMMARTGLGPGALRARAWSTQTPSPALALTTAALFVVRAMRR